MANPYPLDPVDAMTACVVIIECFTSLPFDQMPLHQKAGAVLFYETLMRRIKPALPTDARLDDLRLGIRRAEQVADRIRHVTNLPKVE